MAWQTPKTDWSAADGVRDSDFNRIEQNILELYNMSKVHGALTIHVSPSGNDTLGNGSAASPYATVARAMRDLPGDLGGNNIYINMASGTYAEDVYIHHFTNGTVTLSFTSVTLSSLTISDAHVILEGTTLTFTPSSIGLLIVNRAYVKSNARIEVSGGTNGVYLDEAAQLVTSAAITMYDSTVRPIVVKNGSAAYARIIAGSGHQAGLLVSEGSILAYNTLSLLVAPNMQVIVTESGGRVYTGAQSNNALATAEVI